MTTQTALALTEIGKPLTKITLPGPETIEPRENEVLIKVKAAGLAPLDQKFRDRNFFNIANRLPAVLAGDLVGTVVKIGPGVSFPVGALVFSQMLLHLPTSGGLQEYTVINGEYTAIVPPGVSAPEAALYPINAVCAAMALFSSHGFGFPFPGTPESASFDYASQKIVIVGGGSNIGQLAIQFARAAAIGTIIAIAAPSNSATLEEYGATHIISRHDSDIEDQVRRIVGDDLLYVHDTINFGDHSLAVSLLSNSQRGTIAHNLPGNADKAVLARKKAGVEDKMIEAYSHAIPEFGRLFWKEFPVWLESRKIKPLKYKVIQGLDADKVNAALDEYKAGKGGERYHVSLGV
ncbi:uncharacterized protein Z518_00334 [Rhinocladiella mackenziei CBS 650.93]|uniref:Enoyl reductase (ER) domain-containing protein n=1 Tax=Rhinocladiella mackenziei CBS 650.93 TaxID=1442369 RepID=A0A0D2JIJ7_9EURO|nr:uncharacterized protein Z518_00334 [Rhinocladiella mackenziei CBS 650.93]KIX09255.1 hypothetical protein Z518_00334 [Rhinocladiella mackenziei CBS 650.93]